MKIIIDPRSSYSYGSFYMEELKRVCNNNLHYSIVPFKKLGLLGNDMRFVIEEGSKLLKYFLALNDSYQIHEQDYEWCDVYGSVNANFTHCPKQQYPKLVSLVPSFGVRDSFLMERMLTVLMNLCKAPQMVTRGVEWNKVKQKEEVKLFPNIKHYFGRAYKTWKNRLPLSAYDNHIVSEDNYVFFLSTMWYSDPWNKNDEGVNLRRAYFIEACKSIPTCKFEGGLLNHGGGYSHKINTKQRRNGSKRTNCFVDREDKTQCVGV